jgi:3-mercaptopyruvate sulfurtransferase SseA
MLTGNELRRLTQTQRLVPVIDIRSRQDFNKGHIGGSLNIPLDELETRAVHEVPKTATIVIYCDYYAACETKLKSQGIPSACTLGNLVLEKQGFSTIQILKEGLSQIERAGVQIVRTPELVAQKTSAQQTTP